MNDDSTLDDVGSPDWKPLTRLQRRVVGVLVEKAKTTPTAYPMTLNGIRTGVNQKSNRSPVMDLREEQVESVLYELREMGAAIEVQSSGRVPKFRHQLYEWLGVEKVELAVLAELLLRGEQTVGDLRSRASRMDKIDGMAGLKPILETLIAKNLVVELTPPGRGQIVTHNLYRPEELEKIRSDASRGALGQPSTALPSNASAAAVPAESSQQDTSRLDALQSQVETLQAQMTGLQEDVAQLKQFIQE